MMLRCDYMISFYYKWAFWFKKLKCIKDKLCAVQGLRNHSVIVCVVFIYTVLSVVKWKLCTKVNYMHYTFAFFKYEKTVNIGNKIHKII